ncbi:MAG: hypothetical protein F9K22_11050 [Bacteroidetes bacterium]|nr:MAG: hypothetical protein F9K22_11050 [Bacteroidota bacterium]
MDSTTLHTSNDAPVIGIGEWLITLLITAIPLVGFVMLFVWGFGSGTHPTKANFAKAALILTVIGLVLWFLFIGAIIGAIMSAGGGYES